MSLWQNRPRFSAAPTVRAFFFLSLLAGSGLLPSAAVRAQITPPAVSEVVSEVVAEKPDREQTIYIPYTKLREVFEKEGRGVFLPYSEFQKLWNAAREKPTAPQPGPPVDALITEAENEAVIEKDVVQVSATLTVELLKKGWLHVPLRLGGAALQSAQIDGEPARVLPAEGGGYQLLIHNPEAEPRSIQLQLKYARAFTKAPGQNSVAFDAPQAPVNRWRIRIAEPDVKIEVQPLIAATEVKSDGAGDGKEEQSSDEERPKDAKPDTAKNETVVLAFVGAAPQVTIAWTPRAEGATGLTAIATVQATQEVFISEAAVRTRATLHYDISRSSLKHLAVEVPKDFKVVNVFDANLRKWEVNEKDDAQRIDIELFEPAATTQNVTIELEKFFSSDDEKETKQGDAQPAEMQVTAPAVKAIDVGRQQGIIVVHVDAALRAEVTQRAGLMQLDAAELPANLRSQSWTFAYRYAALPLELELGLVKVQPRITVDQFVEAYLEPERLAVDVLAVFDIAEAGVFQLEFDIPKEMELREVRGQEVPGATPASVDAHHLEGTDDTHLVVNLSKKALGKTAIALHLEQRFDDANLLMPTGNASSIPLAVPRVSQEHVTRVAGRLLLYTPESLRVNPTDLEGLRAISLSEAGAGAQSLRSGRFPSTSASLAFAFSDRAASLTLSVERRKPYVTARQRLMVSVESGVVRYQSMIIYDILYSGVKSLRLDVPADIAADIRNETAGIRETPLDPQPDDVAEGYVAWNLSGQSELVGTQVITLSWERKIDELAIGKSITVDVPRLRPQGVDRAWGQIVITKAETLDVQPSGELVGLRPIDPQHDIMPEAVVPNAARAFEFQGDWSLRLEVTRYQLEEIKRTSIERAVVRMVVTRSRQVGVQALYHLRSAHQRLTVQLPKDIEFDTQPARINGAPVALERGDQDELFIPLAGHDPDQPLVLELRYTFEGSARRLDVPQFPEDPAVQKVYVAVFLPRERTFLGSTGPWTQQWTWRRPVSSDPERDFGWTPAPELSDDQMTAWVTEGVAMTASPPFQRDGTMYLFSALKPQPPPEGSLGIVTLDNKFLAGLVFAALAILALGLMRSPLKSKIAALAALLIAIVICGVMAPSLAQQLFSLPTFAGLAMVLIAWVAWYAYRGASELQHRRARPVFQPAETPQQPPSPSLSPTPPSDPGTSQADDQATSDGGDRDV